MGQEIFGREKKAKEKLFIEEGMRLEVLRSEDDVVFLGRVRSLDGNTLTLANDAGGSVPEVVYGTELKLRGVWVGVGLVTYHGRVVASTDELWKIGEITAWYGWERRNFYRQSISVEAQVLRTYQAQPSSVKGIDIKVECRLLDISASGALIGCSQAVFMSGDRLHVTDAEIIPGEPPFSFECTVMRVEKARFNNIYGCKFEGLSIREQDRMARAVFHLQQLERRALKGRR